MKLTSLRLVGFKSFVDPSEVLIEPGLSGVVGPNGCGKSNLLEALRWVMGESSHKSLRASAMDEVIFGGSANRPARNTAEVSLVIDNSDRTAPAQFNDSDTLEVTRRIEREAGSAYRINGRDARARDVQLLFADASTGAQSPAMVRQGQIGELISAKPRDRRRILEEAAGISGLHGRRHEAELRLRATEQNLARVDDVIGQLESQLEGLKRQARQATRYRSLSAEIRKCEAILWHLRRVAALDAVAAQETVVAETATEVERLTQVAAAAARERADASAALPKLREAEAEAAARLRHLTVTREGIDREKEQALARARELTERYEQVSQDLARERESVTGNAEMVAGLDAEEAELNEQAARAEAERTGLEERAAAAEAELREVEAALNEATSAGAEIAERRRGHERALREAEERLGRIRKQLADTEAERDSLAESDARRSIEALSAEVATAREQAEAAEADAATAEAKRDEARQTREAAREPLAGAEGDLKALETEHATLAKVLAVEEGALWPPLIDNVSVAPGVETALGAALGDELDHPADEGAPIHWREVLPDGSDAALPDGARPLSERVTAPDVLARRLAQTGLVAAEDGPRLQKLLRPGQSLVSAEGDLWRWDGYTAAADAPTAAARKLAQRNRLEELERELTTARDRAAKLRAAAEAADAEARAAAAQAEAARQAVRDAQNALAERGDQLAAAERKAAEETSRLSALDEAKARLQADLEEAGAARQAASEALEALAEEPDMAARIETLKDKVAAARGRSSEARAALDGHRREAEHRDKRLKRIGDERAQWHKRSAAAETQIATLEARAEELRAEAVEIAEVPQTLDARRASLAREIDAAEEKRKAAADALAAGETRQAEADKAAGEADDALASARERRAREEATLEGARQRLADLEETILDALDRPGSEALAAAGLGEADALPAAEELEGRLDKLRRERERLGSVNLRAEEEMREVSERHEALAGERQDLEAAIQRLRGAIQSLNREGRERLLAAFETVNGHFQTLFTRLFGGGAAELKLTESDDPLEAGLEIFARPPGKRLQGLTLLSGGEQALTATALIFAVFLTNPAPVCVLDEVDAPLDDANVERFCNLMEEMARSTETRFLLITHNPITMSRVDRLFGVTMAERGVSQLVSVEIQEAMAIREAG